MLVDGEVAGQDATAAFYGLHRHEVLERPQYARLQVGVVRGEKSVITGRLVGGLSKVPYGEPTYLTEGFHSPYYTEVRFFAFACSEYAAGGRAFLSWRGGAYFGLSVRGVERDARRIIGRSRRWFAGSSTRWCTLMRRSASSTGSGLARRFLTKWREARLLCST